MEQLQGKLMQLREALDNVDTSNVSAVIGFDGFVDEIIEVVDKRHSFDSYTRMSTIAEFGARISKAAGLSTNIEFVPKTVKLGGNGPIMANAMVSTGVKVTYLGAIGLPTIHPVFQELVDRCVEAIPLTEPGHTDAVEFNDGKVMLGKLESINDINWASLIKLVGEERIKSLFSEADLIAMVNWTMTPHMNEIWENLLQVLPPQREGEKPILFIDLADPEKRKLEDIRITMNLIQKFNPYYRVALGLNRKEATEIAEVLELSLSDDPSQVSLEEIVRALGESLRLWCVMVHPTNGAGAVINREYAYASGPYTSKPRLTTGAGDNFNSGFCLGLLLGLSTEDSLRLGTATSGYYVRQMHSPSFTELKDFVSLWAEHVGEDF